MRVVSQYRNYSGITARPEISELVSTAHGAERRIVQPALRAEPFRWGDVTEWERIEALRAWPAMRGLTDGENPVWRLSSFDTVQWQLEGGYTDEERELMENALRNGPGAGSDYIIVERPRVPAPYPRYDEHRRVQGKRTLDHVLRDIQAVYDSAGFDVEQAVAYERENGNDGAVVEFLQGLGETVTAEAEVVEA